MTTPHARIQSSDLGPQPTGRKSDGSRAQTGIVELDDMLEGGFMRGDSVLIAGTAGSGKTTLALQYIVNGIEKYGENGVYVTFEQMPDQIYRDGRNFGWDLRELEEQDKFRLVCTSPSLLLESDGENLLDEIVGDIQPRRIVVDSLSHMEMFSRSEELRMEAYRLISFFKTRGISSLLIWEAGVVRGDPFTITDAGIGFLVDCIVSLRPVEIDSSLHRALVVMKMRGSDHDKRLREYEITSRGFSISAPFTNYEGVMTGNPKRSVTEDAANNWALAFGKNKQTHS